jgi:serine/threonine protein kinase
MNQPVNHDRIDDLFAQAVDLPPEERQAFLSSACNGDADIQAEVEKLLAAHENAERATEFLASTPKARQITVDYDENSDDPLIGQQIGPYEIEKRLGGGGFGDVYFARRTKEFKQTVAIKVVRDVVRDLPRFERERQLLADLRHENIARLLDGGTLSDGRPYIIMEFIDGRPITQYCDENRLPVKERLALFKQVCKAVAFAHAYGAIHRDIKPLNILVNEQGIVKLLDFGIAKLLDSPSRGTLVPIPQPVRPDAMPDAETVSFALDSSSIGITGTAPGFIAPMSPPYASPEQARGKEVSTASDIYSLAVVLYELLTGYRPYYFQRNTLEEVQRVICEVEPPKPSAVVVDPSLLKMGRRPEETASPETLAELRGTTTKMLHRTLKGDLEAVVLKSLAKDLPDRYQTVEKLNDELERFDRALPVDARQISRIERTARLMRRHKSITALATVAIIALVGGTVVSTLFALESRHQAAAALAAAEQEKKAKETAVQRETETSAVLDFVENKIFAAARPKGQEGGLGHDVTLRQAIESAMSFVDAGFEDQPLIEARLRNALGMSFSYLGEAQRAAQQFEIARDLCTPQVGPHHPYTLLSINNLAVAYFGAGRLDEAIPLYEQTLAARRKKLGADHPDTLDSMNNLAIAYRKVGRLDQALPLYEQTLAARQKQLGPGHPDTLASMNGLALAYRASGRLDESLALYEQTLAAHRNVLGPDHPDTHSSMHGLAIAYHAAGRRDEAIKLFEKTLAARRKKLGADHPDTLTSMNDLASAFSDADRLDEAIPLYKRTLAARRKKLGEDHPDTLASMSGLANAHRAAGRLDDAIPLYERTLAAMQKKLGADHPHTLGLMNGLANAYHAADRRDEALPLFEKSLATMRKKLGADHPDTLTSMNNLANAYSDAGRPDEAIPLYEQTLAARRKKLGADHPDTLDSMNNLAIAYRDAGRLDEALPLFDQVVAEAQKRLGPEHPNTQRLILSLAGVYYQAGHLEESIAMCEPVLPSMRKTLGVGHPDTLHVMEDLANAYVNVGRVKDAIRLYEEMLPSMVENQDLDHRDRQRLDRVAIMMKLAFAYHTTGRLKESIPLLEQTAAVARESFGSDDPVTLGVMVGLSGSYFDAGRVDQAIRLFEETLVGMRKKLGSNHPVTVATLNSLSWILATVPIDDLRDGKRAVELATEACQRTDYGDPNTLRTLAAAYAETGDYDSAVKWSKKSLELFGAEVDAKLREEFSRALANYKAKKPMRQAPASAPDEEPRANQPAEAKPTDPPLQESATTDTTSTGQK